jgi:valyl-tRNA synthetase
LDITQHREIAVAFQTPEATDEAALSANLSVVRGVGKIAELNVVASDATLPPSATAIIDRRTISSPLVGLISDPQAELTRLRKRKAKAMQDLASQEGRLENEKFVASAPANIVAEVHERIDKFKREIAQLEEQERLIGDL